MKCPYCAYQESKVVDSRHSDDGTSIRTIQGEMSVRGIEMDVEKGGFM